MDIITSILANSDCQLTTDRGRAIVFGAHIPESLINHYNFLDICSLQPRVPERIFFNLMESISLLQLSVISFDTTGSIALENRPIECPSALPLLIPRPRSHSPINPWHFSTCSLLEVQELVLCERLTIPIRPHLSTIQVVTGMIVRYRNGLQVSVGEVRLDSLKTTVHLEEGVKNVFLHTTERNGERNFRIVSGLSVRSDCQNAYLAVEIPLRGSLIWWFRVFSCIIQHQTPAGQLTPIFRSRRMRRVMRGSGY